MLCLQPCCLPCTQSNCAIFSTDTNIYLCITLWNIFCTSVYLSFEKPIKVGLYVIFVILVNILKEKIGNLPITLFAHHTWEIPGPHKIAYHLHNIVWLQTIFSKSSLVLQAFHFIGFHKLSFFSFSILSVLEFACVCAHTCKSTNTHSWYELPSFLLLFTQPLDTPRLCLPSITWVQLSLLFYVKFYTDISKDKCLHLSPFQSTVCD